MKKNVFVILFILIIMIGNDAFAKNINVHFAGFAFRGDQEQISKNYPRTLQISKEKTVDQRSILDATLVNKIKNIKLKNGQIVIGELAKLQEASLTLACCIDTELVSVEQHEDGYKLVIDIGGQALFFDYSKMRVVASYPILVELIDFLPEKPNDALINSRMRELLFTNKYETNLFDEFIETIESTGVKKSYGHAMQVTNVIVEEKALKYLPPQFKDNSTNFKTFVAQNFAKFLSQNQGVSILPYTKGSDIGGKMALRFSDSRVFELEIPKPQFSVELTMRGFKKICTEKKASGSCWIYGAYSNINISQPALGKVYLDEKFKHGVSKIVPVNQKTVEDWPSYQNSLMALYNKVTKEFTTNRKYKAVKEVVKKCS